MAASLNPVSTRYPLYYIKSLHQEEGSSNHIWTCPETQGYYKEVHTMIVAASTLPQEVMPAQFLLHFSKISACLYCTKIL